MATFVGGLRDRQYRIARDPQPQRAGNLLDVAAPPQDPFRPADWAVFRPRLRVQDRWLDQGLPLRLAGQDSVYAGPGQVPGYDWQRPRIAVPQLRPPVHVDGGVLDTLAGQDQFYGAPGQAPDYDWQLPRIAPPRERPPIHVDSGVLDTLLGQDQFYGAPGQAIDFDWPLPIPKRRARSLLSHDDQGVLDTLLGQDAFYGAPGQAITIDWPLPRRLARVPDGLTGPMTASEVQTPLLPLDWPLPIRVRRALQDFSLWVNYDEMLDPPTLVLRQHRRRSYDLPPVRRRAIIEMPSSPMPPVQEIPTTAASQALPVVRVRRADIGMIVGAVPIGEDQFYGAPGQAIIFDYPLPIPVRRTRALTFSAWQNYDEMLDPPVLVLRQQRRRTYDLPVRRILPRQGFEQQPSLGLFEQPVAVYLWELPIRAERLFEGLTSLPNLLLVFAPVIANVYLTVEARSLTLTADDRSLTITVDERGLTFTTEAS